MKDNFIWICIAMFDNGRQPTFFEMEDNLIWRKLRRNLKCVSAQPCLTQK